MIGVDLGGKLNRGASGDVLIAVDGADVVLSLISARGGHRELHELRRFNGVADGASSWWYENALIVRYDDLLKDFWTDNGWEPTYFKPMITTKKNSGISDEEFAEKYGPWIKWILEFGYWDEVGKFFAEFYVAESSNEGDYGQNGI